MDRPLPRFVEFIDGSADNLPLQSGSWRSILRITQLAKMYVAIATAASAVGQCVLWEAAPSGLSDLAHVQNSLNARLLKRGDEVPQRRSLIQS